MSDNEKLDLNDLRERVDGIKFAMLTTIDDQGTLSSRPLTVQDIDEEGHVVFVVDKTADWVSGGVEAANVALTDDKTWVSVAGRLTFSDSQTFLDELWNEQLDAFFPDGKANATVAHVTAERWEYWVGPNKVSQVFQIAKAKISGDTPDLGSSGTIDL